MNKAPTLIKSNGIDAVRVERAGFVFIARKVGNYDKLPGFRKVEVYTSQTADAPEMFVRYLTSAEICSMHRAFERAVFAAEAGERAAARERLTKWQSNTGDSRRIPRLDSETFRWY